jgi:predicted DNA-binding transcriptional regulator AlpA
VIFSDEFVSALATAVADQLSERIAGSTGGMTKRLLSTQEAATYLGLRSANALRQRKAAGQVPQSCFVKMGGSVLWDREGLDEWISSLKEVA